MNGIGKGRQAAAMIRFAYKQGKIPVFITAKKALFSDMYRDLKSIGNSDLRPFIWAAKVIIKSENGNKYNKKYIKITDYFVV